jgi:hypothetical protein
MTAYDNGYYYPATYYTPSYSYEYYNGYPSSYYYEPTYAGTRYYNTYWY